MEQKPTLVVLAAGIGSRYGGIKQIDPMGPHGETILDYSIFDAIKAGFGKVVFIIRKDIEEDFIRLFHDKIKGMIQVEYVFQELDSLIPEIYLNPARTKPWGTGHALLCAKEKINGPFSVINADDFYGFSAFHQMAQFLSAHTDPKENCLVGYWVENTLSDNGTVSRGICTQNESGFLTSVVERTKIYWKNSKIYFDEGESTFPLDPKTLVSMNFWGFKPNIFPAVESLFHQFLKDSVNQIKSEFYIPTFVNHFLGNREAYFKVYHSHDSWFGVTYQEDKPIVKKSIQNLILSGKYPNNLWGSLK